ncbi:RNA recognition motif domain containing protein [Acanthamoeba castellanii str. Neff]|uniref:RNA recognition motif domain containing protein n=1 Tax=Acanthamoeba castellanii (strain ATCC 30010 / Neff) TaxID=1257118 RepID=L8GHK6_ACACF|nr:RNA recognition motif domain containing protein [Acanthamoeba castellanii str. Neff]ELR11656.1 RNA recognition motif domain containing protein [Acanthamoeba castellanii str. Neff]
MRPPEGRHHRHEQEDGAEQGLRLCGVRKQKGCRGCLRQVQRLQHGGSPPSPRLGRGSGPSLATRLAAARRPGGAAPLREAGGAGAALPGARRPGRLPVARLLLRGGPRRVRPRALRHARLLARLRDAAPRTGPLLLAALRAPERTSAPGVLHVPLRLAPTRGAGSMTRSKKWHRFERSPHPAAGGIK